MDFITPDEKRALEARLQEMHKRRPEIVQRIAEARAMGDLKENAEYHAAREEQGMNEAEIRRLEERLATARVIEEGAVPEGVIFVGAIFKLKDLRDDEVETYRLVGESSGNHDDDIIEITADSPMGESMVKARVGDVIKVDAPRGTLRFEVVEIL